MHERRGQPASPAARAPRRRRARAWADVEGGAHAACGLARHAAVGRRWVRQPPGVAARLAACAAVAPSHRAARPRMRPKRLRPGGRHERHGRGAGRAPGCCAGAASCAAPPAALDANLARPKSPSLMSPRLSKKMLAGLRSRWMMPCAWMCASPASSCRTTCARPGAHEPRGLARGRWGCVVLQGAAPHLPRVRVEHRALVQGLPQRARAELHLDVEHLQPAAWPGLPCGAHMLPRAHRLCSESSPARAGRAPARSGHGRHLPAPRPRRRRRRRCRCRCCSDGAPRRPPPRRRCRRRRRTATRARPPRTPRPHSAGRRARRLARRTARRPAARRPAARRAGTSRSASRPSPSPPASRGPRPTAPRTRPATRRAAPGGARRQRSRARARAAGASARLVVAHDARVVQTSRMRRPRAAGDTARMAIFLTAYVRPSSRLSACTTTP